jgi:hypothetical protein
VCEGEKTQKTLQENQRKKLSRKCKAGFSGPEKNLRRALFAISHCLPNWFSQTVYGLYIEIKKICACIKNLRLQTKKEIYFFLKYFSVFGPFIEIFQFFLCLFFFK